MALNSIKKITALLISGIILSTNACQKNGPHKILPCKKIASLSRPQPSIFGAIRSNELEKVRRAVYTLEELSFFGLSEINELDLSPLAYAVCIGARTKIIQCLLENKAPTEFIRESDNFYLLDLLTEETVSFLRWKQHPLLSTEEKKEAYLAKIAFLLLDNNAPFTEKTVARAQKNGLEKVAQLMEINMPNASGSTRLIEAIAQRENNIEKIQGLVRQGACVNRTSRNHKLPLCYAIERNDSQCASFFLTEAIRINERDGEGKTPLHHAIIRQNPVITKILFKKGADWTQPDNTGNTALHYYCKTDLHGSLNISMPDFLWQDKKKALTIVAQPNAEGNLPIHLAAENTKKYNYCHSASAILGKILLEYAPEKQIVHCNNYKQTPLARAARSNNLHLAKQILRYKEALKTVNQEDFNNETPLHWAISNENTEMVKLLLNYGAQKSIRTKEQVSNTTPLSLAQRLKNKKIHSLLTQHIAPTPHQNTFVPMELNEQQNKPTLNYPKAYTFSQPHFEYDSRSQAFWVS